MRGAGLNASWSGVIPTMGLSVPVVMDPLCGIARDCDDKLLVCEWRDGHDECGARRPTATTTTATVGDGRADAVCNCAEQSP